MDVKVGDKVRFLNDVGDGTVVNILDKNTVTVLGQDGFEVPTLMSELIVIESAPVAEEKSIKKVDEVLEISESMEIEDDVVIDINKEVDFSELALDEELNIFLAIVPIDEERKKFEIYLINDSPYNLLYTFSFQDNDKLYFIEANKLEEDTKIKLYTLDIEKINEIKAFNFQALSYVAQSFKYKKPIDATIPFNPVKLYKEKVFTENDYFEEDAYVINILKDNYFKEAIEKLSNQDFGKIIHSKEKRINPQQKNIQAKQRKDFENEVIEVDLHIQELIDRVEGLENGEKLDIQLNHFEEKLNAAIAERKKKIVFIHGVGNGVLKVRLRNILDSKYKHLKYQDASFQQYGYGATMVFLRN